MVGEAIRAMPPEGFNVLVGLALALLWFNSPSDCDSTLVFGISNGGSNTVPLMKTSPRVYMLRLVKPYNYHLKIRPIQVPQPHQRLQRT